MRSSPTGQPTSYNILTSSSMTQEQSDRRILPAASSSASSSSSSSSSVTPWFHNHNTNHHHRHFRSDPDQYVSTESSLTNNNFNFDISLEELLQNYHNKSVSQLECELLHHTSASATTGFGTSTTTTNNHVCSPIWDNVLCWPATPTNTSAIQPCFSELNGIKYDDTKNASKWCHPNGTWALFTNYSACLDTAQQSVRDPNNSDYDPGIEVTSYIFFVGYTISLLALIIAITIFLYFKDLKCLRNTIHTNLMFTYVLADFMWILTSILQFNVQSDITWCIFLIVLLHYFHLTNFFWMFVEGLYLYMLVVETFYTENMKLKVYAVIGWGGPVIFVIAWATAKSFTVSDNIDPVTNTSSADSSLLHHCPWMTPHNLDWIYQAPALIVLASNLIFLLMIMWVLITKLRSANNVETQQYRKATKALVVLIPLLGTTYILVITGPTEGISRNIYEALRAILLSTQGFTVALFYCFLNTEVQNTLRHYIGRWKETRSLKGGHRYRYHSKDWSPRSHTESIRLCINPPTKRESTVSETTTTTLLNNGGRMSNGSGTRQQFLQANDEHLGE